MWTPYLAAISSLLIFQVVHAQQNPACFQGNVPIERLEYSPEALQAALEDSVARFCEQNSISRLAAKTTIDHAPVDFEITVEREGSPQDDKKCIQAVQTIIEVCILGQNASGGMINANDNAPTCTVTTRPVGDLEARASKPKAPQKAPAKAPVKPPAKTSTKPIGTPTPKASSIGQSSVPQTSSVAKPTPTKTCKKLYSELLAESKQAALAEKRHESLSLRQGFSGSRVHVEKRWTPKSTLACGYRLKALDYPQKTEMPKNANWYGFVKPDVCDDIVFRAAAKPAAGIPNSDYQNKAEAGIFGAQKITGQIKGSGRGKQKKLNIDTAKSALLKLKNLLGARKYMNSKEIQGILKKQRNRMGEMLARLDTEMVNHPRPNYNAWQPQQLGTLWNKYMDQKFAEAKTRTERDMENYLAMLVQTWTPVRNQDQNHKDFFANIEKVKNEWILEKRRPWVAPW